MTPIKPLQMLCSSAQFRAVYRNGQRFHSPYFSAFLVTTDTGIARLGITATRKVGKAVVRNLCKRRIRDVFRRCQPASLAEFGFDLVINVKTELATARFEVVASAFQQTLLRFQAFQQRQERIKIEAEVDHTKQ